MTDVRGKQCDVLLVQLPSPPFQEVLRDYAGGFGIALPSSRSDYGHGSITQPSLSLAYAHAALVRDGRRATFVDAQAEGLGLHDLRQRFLHLAPRVIVSVVNLPSLASDIAVLGQLKEATGAHVVAVGTVCRASELLEAVFETGSVDSAVTGDAEVVVPRLVDALLDGARVDVDGVATRDGHGRIVQRAGGELSDLDALPIPDFGALPLDRYRTWEFGRSARILGRQVGDYPRYFPLYFSRGCPYACSYCPYPVGVGKTWRRKSVGHVIEEFEQLAAAGTYRVLLRDQTVGEDLDYIADVCESFLAAGLRTQWLCETRPGSLPLELMKLMRKAGCVRIHYGVETGDAAVFALQAKRGIDPAVIDTCLARTEEAGIVPSLHFLVGFPQDTWQSIAATLRLIERCGVSNGDCALMTPYPGTRYYDRMRAEGRILVSGWEEFTGTEPIVAVDGLSPVELVTARWRILSALQANGRQGIRRRLGDAVTAMKGGRDALAAGPPIDGAIARSIPLAAEPPRPTAVRGA